MDRRFDTINDILLSLMRIWIVKGEMRQHRHIKEKRDFQIQLRLFQISFLEGTVQSWFQDSKDAFREHTNVNLVSVDWRYGSQILDYFQAASNSQVIFLYYLRYFISLIRILKGL